MGSWWCFDSPADPSNPQAKPNKNFATCYCVRYDEINNYAKMKWKMAWWWNGIRFTCGQIRTYPVILPTPIGSVTVFKQKNTFFDSFNDIGLWMCVVDVPVMIGFLFVSLFLAQTNNSFLWIFYYMESFLLHSEQKEEWEGADLISSRISFLFRCLFDEQLEMDTQTIAYVCL